MSTLGKKDLGVRKFDLLFSQDKIARRIREIGAEISRDYEDKDPILVGILKGCVVFMADLIRAISIPIEIEFVNATSYSNGQIQDDKVVLSDGPEVDLRNRHILIVEGVVDSGNTVDILIKNLSLMEPASIEIVTLLDKPNDRQKDVNIKYIGFDAGDDFVIGYGLDVSQKYRNLPFIGKVID
ncbi:MAG: hypoxanthine phosphoribosyltransferase [Candidatus Zixiibacteriota bacterium]